METLPINGFNGVDEITEPGKLGPEVLAALDNMELDSSLGIATIRKGFSRYGQLVVTGGGSIEASDDADKTPSDDSDAGATDDVSGGVGSGTINNLFDVEDSNGNNFLLANAGTELKKAADGTGAWSDIKIGLTAAKMRMAAYGDKFIFTNGNENPFYTDLTNVWNIGLDKPDITGITAVAAVGTDIVPFDAQYIIVYIMGDGQKSNASNQFEVPGTDRAGVDLLYTSVTFSNIPGSSDSRVKSIRIYRTKKGVYDTFYLLTEIDNPATVASYQDVTADSSLDSTETIEYLNTPTKAKYILSNGERIFMASLTKKMTNRVIPPVFFYDYSNLILSAAHGGGSMSLGVYKYAVSFVDSDGNESELVPYFTYTLTGTDSAIYFFMFAYPVVNHVGGLYAFLPGIKLVRLYRTTAGGSDYLWHSDILVPLNPVDNFSLIDDTTADVSLGVVYPKETVHNPNEVVNLPSSVIYSNLYNFMEFPELNYYEVYPDDSEPIMGILDDDNGIMIPKEASFCKTVTVGDPSNWTTQKLVENIGCDQPDSIYKYGSTYFFVFRNKVYAYSGSGEPKCISYKRKPTFDSVTEFLGATFYNSVLWYVLTVKIVDDYYLLCYDTKLETWYKFSIYQADTVIEKKFGTDKGKLLFGGDLYITQYNLSQDYDNDSGPKVDITVYLKTKDYSFPDNFITARLMFMFINYYRLVNTTAQEVVFTLTDPVTGLYRSLADPDESVLQNIFKIVTDGMDGTLQRCYKLNLSISGEAISKFYGAKVEYNAEPWRIAKKHAVKKITDDADKQPSDDVDKVPVDDISGASKY